MSTIFTKIVNGEIPCYKVAETPDFLAFLDVRPLAAGHTLVIPKKEIDYIFDLEFKTSKDSNSGVFIRNPKPGDWYAGIEIQILDSFGKNPPDKHDAAALYDVLVAKVDRDKATGELFNQTKK